MLSLNDFKKKSICKSNQLRQFVGGAEDTQRESEGTATERDNEICDDGCQSDTQTTYYDDKGNYLSTCTLYEC